MKMGLLEILMIEDIADNIETRNKEKAEAIDRRLREGSVDAPIKKYNFVNKNSKKISGNDIFLFLMASLPLFGYAIMILIAQKIFLAVQGDKGLGNLPVIFIILYLILLINLSSKNGLGIGAKSVLILMYFAVGGMIASVLLKQYFMVSPAWHYVNELYLYAKSFPEESIIRFLGSALSIVFMPISLLVDYVLLLFVPSAFLLKVPSLLFKK